MRKIKKINGYLIVKFNDREKRKYDGTGLGEYGIIDAEHYTGRLITDRDFMEHDDIASLEVAVEVARNLVSEMDITEETATCTIVVESDHEYHEEVVNPEALIESWEQTLAVQVSSVLYPYMDENTAAHELYGFKMALYQIGILNSNDISVDPLLDYNVQMQQSQKCQNKNFTYRQDMPPDNEGNIDDLIPAYERITHQHQKDKKQRLQLLGELLETYIRGCRNCRSY